MDNAEAQPQAEAAPERNMADIAARHFGRRYHGSVEAQPEAAPAEPAEPTEEITDDAVRDGLQEQAEEPEAEAEAEAEAAQELIDSLTELVEANEWDPEWVNTLRVPVKVNGSEGEATLDQLVRSYQTQEAASQVLEQAKAQREAVRQQVQQTENASKAQMAVLGGLVQQIESQLQADESAINWQQLRQQDPAEYAARRDEMRERRASLDQVKQQALSQYQQAMLKSQEAEQQQRQEHLRVEQAALLEKLPAWRDAEVARAEQTQLVDYLIGRGFTQDEAMGASDHRLILLARDAMLYLQGRTKTDAAAKKVQKVPKVLRPGAPKSPEQRSKQQQGQLRRQVRRATSTQQALGSALELMKSRRT